MEANQRQRARQLRDLLTSLGPAFVKVGQALSSRPDLLPQSYLEVCPSFQSATLLHNNAVLFLLEVQCIHGSQGQAPAPLHHKCKASDCKDRSEELAVMGFQ